MEILDALTPPERTTTEAAGMEFEHFKLYIDVYKHHFDLCLKGIAIFVTVTGAILGFVFHAAATPATQTSLLTLCSAAAIVSFLALRGAKKWLSEFDENVYLIAQRLDLPRFPLSGSYAIVTSAMAFALLVALASLALLCVVIWFK